MTERLKPSQEPAGTDEPVVFVVDDDASLRESLNGLFRSVGLGGGVRLRPSCCAARFRMFPAAWCSICGCREAGWTSKTSWPRRNRHPDHLHHRARRHPDDGASHEGRRRRVPDQAVPRPGPARRSPQALERDRAFAREWQAWHELRGAFQSLTPREREVMALVTGGLMNKQVAGGAGRQRDHGEGPPRPRHAKDGGQLARRSGQNGRNRLASRPANANYPQT